MAATKFVELTSSTKPGIWSRSSNNFFVVICCTSGSWSSDGTFCGAGREKFTATRRAHRCLHNGRATDQALLENSGNLLYLVQGVGAQGGHSPGYVAADFFATFKIGVVDFGRSVFRVLQNTQFNVSNIILHETMKCKWLPLVKTSKD